MTIGPGRYDDLCTYVATHADIRPGGAAIVIILGGKHGAGFSCQANPLTMALLPDLLETVAAQIRADTERMPT
jgi:hypothetical protein